MYIQREASRENMMSLVIIKKTNRRFRGDNVLPDSNQYIDIFADRKVFCVYVQEMQKKYITLYLKGYISHHVNKKQFITF